MRALARTKSNRRAFVLLLIITLAAGLLPATSATGAIGEVLTYPPGARTGYRRVDRVIAAWQRKDAEALTKLVKYNRLPCVKAYSPDFPQCEEDEPAGTLVKAFLIGGCEFNWITESYVPAYVKGFLTANHRLFAVRSNPTVYRRRLRAKYEIILAIKHEPIWETSAIWLDRDGRIRKLTFTHCGSTPCEVFAHPSGGGQPYLLPPRRQCPPVNGNGTAVGRPGGPDAVADASTTWAPAR